MTNIYILKLQHGKYYVGKTDNLERRKQEHINGTACSWTKKHPLISVEQIIPNASDFDEDKYTKEYMHKFGIDNVRGAAYVKDELDEGEIQQIQKEIWGAKNLCNKCGRDGHFVKSCRAKTDVNGNSLVYYVCEYCEEDFDTEESCEKHERYCKSKKIIKIKTCFECGESGHYTNECPNEEDEETFNCRYCDKEFETQKGAIFHENVHCKNKNKNVNITKSSRSSSVTCYRCGRGGHKSPDCYARTDVDGDYIDSDSD